MTKAPKSPMSSPFLLCPLISPRDEGESQALHTAIFATGTLLWECQLKSKNYFWVLHPKGLHPKYPSPKSWRPRETEKTTQPPLQVVCQALGPPILVAQQVPRLRSEQGHVSAHDLDQHQSFWARTPLQGQYLWHTTASTSWEIIRVFAPKSQQHLTWEKRQEKQILWFSFVLFCVPSILETEKALREKRSNSQCNFNFKDYAIQETALQGKNKKG